MDPFFLLLLSRYSKWAILSIGFCSFSLFFFMHFFLCICAEVLFNNLQLGILFSSSAFKIYYHIIHTHTTLFDLFALPRQVEEINWRRKSKEKKRKKTEWYICHDVGIIIASSSTISFRPEYQIQVLIHW